VRFVLAIVSFVVAALLIGLGIAQKTVLAAPDEVTASASITSSAPVTVISGEALNAYPRSQFVEIGGSDTSFAAYGRTTDVLAWIGDASYNDVEFDADNTELVSKVVSGTDTEVPTPVGSDLWLASYTDESGITINVPDDVSLLIVSDGIEPAPSEVSVTWPLDNSTPWANTIVVAGGVLLLLGLLLLLWALLHMRRGRGPRRKSQKMPKLPKQRGYKAIKSKPKAVEANAKGRRSIAPRIAIVPLVLVGALTLGGCTSDFWAGREPVQAPTASADPEAAAEAEAADQLPPPAVTELQAERIAKNVSEVAAAADAANDDTLIASRLTGPALELRTSNYAQRRANAEIAAPEAIPVGKFLMILPQQTENWPRTVLAIVEDTAVTAEGAQLAPVSMMLVQESPRENYKAAYVMRLEPGATIPDVAPTSVGAVRQGPDSKLLALAPGLIAPDYADILMNDTASASNELFQAEGDSLRPAAGKAFKDASKAKTETTSTLEYTGAEATGPVVALSTNDSGAVVAVNINELETTKVVEAGATVNPPADVKALTGKTSSTKGFTRTYGYQLLFFVPPVNTGGKIVLLGYSTATIAASETP